MKYFSAKLGEKLGEERIIKEICVEHTCQECGEPAQYMYTYLLKGARSNPQSSAYGKDDCSWCEDDRAYACEEHKVKVERDVPEGMVWCSTFPRKNFEHLFLYWKQSVTVGPGVELVERKLNP